MTTDPFTLFDDWYEQARLNEVNDSNAMALATADAQGRPSVRMVLLKGHGPDGFVFYTNYEGRKAADLRSEEHTSELQSLMRISYAVFCLKKTIKNKTKQVTP